MAAFFLYATVYKFHKSFVAKMWLKIILKILDVKDYKWKKKKRKGWYRILETEKEVNITKKQEEGKIEG